MAKLTFAQVGAPYRGAIGEFQFYMKRFASYLDKSAGAASDLLKTIKAYFDYAGTVFTVKDTSTQSATGTLAVNGAGLDVALPTTAKIIKSGVKVTMPQASGSYVNGYTFTVVNGAITAAVAS